MALMHTSDGAYMAW